MNPTFDLPEEDPDDVGLDQSPDLGFAFFEIAVQTSILQRDRCLRGKQLQHREPGRREDAGGQVVLEVKRADELGLDDQGQAENRSRLALTDVGIRGKRWLGRGIVENDALPGTQHIVENRSRQHGRVHGFVAQYGR